MLDSYNIWQLHNSLIFHYIIIYYIILITSVIFSTFYVKNFIIFGNFFFFENCGSQDACCIRLFYLFLQKLLLVKTNIVINLTFYIKSNFTSLQKVMHFLSALSFCFQWTSVHDIQTRDPSDYENAYTLIEEEIPEQFDPEELNNHRPTDLWMGYISLDEYTNQNRDLTHQNLGIGNFQVPNMGILNSGLIGMNSSYSNYFRQHPEQRNKVKQNLVLSSAFPVLQLFKIFPENYKCYYSCQCILTSVHLNFISILMIIFLLFLVRKEIQ